MKRARRIALVLAVAGFGQSVGASAVRAQSSSVGAAVAPPERLLNEAYSHLAARDLHAARVAFAAADEAGGPRQRISLELGYLSLVEGQPDEARSHFDAASRGPDAELARRGRAEARLLPRHLWADVYGEALAWSRTQAAQPVNDAVSTVRARFLWRPRLTVDLNLYGFAQATRDLASHGAGAAELPQIYADDYALFGAGVFARLWRGRVGLFAQLGPAVDLLDDGRERLAFDARAGLFGGAQSAGCQNTEDLGRHWQARPCLEGYGEATYVNRFHDNVIGIGRVRAGLTYLETGPVAWQVLAEARVVADRNHDYYNNLFDGGIVQRFRVRAAVPFDLALGAHVGRLMGVEGRDPAPAQLGYRDLRALGASSFSF
jgi:hypothetical protein